MPRIFDGQGRLIFPEVGEAPRTPVPRDRGQRWLARWLFCHRGHPLIELTNVPFDQEPGIRLLCEGPHHREQVVLSPFFRDQRKIFEVGFVEGTILTLRCPHCEERLPILAAHDCWPGASLVLLFLDRGADPNRAIAVCNAWGCFGSVLLHAEQVIAELHQQAQGLAP